MITKTQIRNAAEAKGYSLVKAEEAYKNGTRIVWGAKDLSGKVSVIGQGAAALDAISTLVAR